MNAEDFSVLVFNLEDEMSVWLYDRHCAVSAEQVTKAAVR
jgi:hypothetical protein